MDLDHAFDTVHLWQTVIHNDEIRSFLCIFDLRYRFLAGERPVYGLCVDNFE
jgi:hypothetical protein